MSSQRKLLIVIMTYMILWNSQYALEYLPSPFDFCLILFAPIFMFGLWIIGIIQIYKYFRDSNKSQLRVVNIGLITTLVILSILKPDGLINFKKLEGDNFILAVHEGVANCTTTLALKNNSKFKETSICFGIDHTWGEYKITNDTIELYYLHKGNNSILTKYAVMRSGKHPTKSNPKDVLEFYRNGTRNKSLPMEILESKDYIK